jgi:proton-coupled amino acid transporter
MSTPTKPVNISSPRQQPAEELTGSPGRFNYGTPSQRAQGQPPSTPPIANIPRYGSPSNLGIPGSLSANAARGLPFRPRTPAIGSGAGSAGGGGTPVIPAFVSGGRRESMSGTGSGTSTPRNVEDVSSDEMARVLRRHLVSREERQGLGGDHDEDIGTERDRSGGDSRASVHSASGVQREDSEPFPIPYHAPGGDITCVPDLKIFQFILKWTHFFHYRHPIYKWQQEQRRQAIVRPRSVSYATPPQPANPVIEQLHQPGGFRRNYVLQRANEQGLGEPTVSNNFIEFLYLFGHFVSHISRW